MHCLELNPYHSIHVKKKLNPTLNIYLIKNSGNLKHNCSDTFLHSVMKLHLTGLVFNQREIPSSRHSLISTYLLTRFIKKLLLCSDCSTVSNNDVVVGHFLNNFKQSRMVWTLKQFLSKWTHTFKLYLIIICMICMIWCVCMYVCMIYAYCRSLRSSCDPLCLDIFSYSHLSRW